MREREDVTAKVVKVFRKRKILTFDEIRAIADWSPMTLWRNLKPLGYHTSYNFNARYYTLAGIPRFDENGLWFYRRVGFSSYGTLNRTCVAMVENSDTGMTPSELSAVLAVRVQNQLSALYDKDQVDRTKWGRTYLYVSREEAVATAQLRRRERQRQRVLLEAYGDRSPTDEETIEILAELVRRPRASARAVAIVLSARGLNVTRDKVLTVIDRYGLKKRGPLRRSKR